jgi:hypothetical protein
MKIRFLLFVLLFSFSSFSCVKDNNVPTPDPDPDPDPELPGNFSIRQVRRLPSLVIESSGVLALSNNILWTHNDSGNTPDLFRIDTMGQITRTLRISNVQNNDWEDLAIDPQGRFYICDTGNNNNNRTNLAIYRIPNPETISGNTVTAEIIGYSFQDQTAFPPPQNQRHYDVEGVIWRNDSLFMFTKDRSSPFEGTTRLYAIPAQPGTHVAKLMGGISIEGNTHQARITAADINHQTGEVVLLTGSRIFSFKNYPGSRFLEGTKTEYKFPTQLGQAEAISFFGAKKLYITEEGSSGQGGFLYEVGLP